MYIKDINCTDLKEAFWNKKKSR